MPFQFIWATKLHDAVVARSESVVETLNADVVFWKVDQMLFHGEFLRVFVFPLGLSPFGMCILPSGADNSKDIKEHIFDKYKAE